MAALDVRQELHPEAWEHIPRHGFRWHYVRLPAAAHHGHRARTAHRAGRGLPAHGLLPRRARARAAPAAASPRAAAAPPVARVLERGQPARPAVAGAAHGPPSARLDAGSVACAPRRAGGAQRVGAPAAGAVHIGGAVQEGGGGDDRPAGRAAGRPASPGHARDGAGAPYGHPLPRRRRLLRIAGRRGQKAPEVRRPPAAAHRSFCRPTAAARVHRVGLGELVPRARHEECCSQQLVAAARSGRAPKPVEPARAAEGGLEVLGLPR
mmetsp:Transcript_100438/g.265282  ORF Transcript_100438/g.265282 Transcript_100438/m.265282 type:complete len:266 (-) Transcript_100438:50-847(-)